MGLSSITVFCFLQLFFLCFTADGYSIGHILNNTMEEESNITSTKNEQPIVITSQSSIPIEDLSTSIPIKVFKALLLDNNATTTNNSSISEEESAEPENFLNEIISDEEFTQSILSTTANISSVNETTESTKLDVLSTLPTTKTTTTPPIINTTTIPSIESTTSLPKSLYNENSLTSPPVQNENTNSTSSMDLMNSTKTLSIETTTELNNSLIEPTDTEVNTTITTTILFSQTSEEEYFENDTITTTEFLVDSTTTLITSTMDTINSFVDTENDSSLIVSSTEMASQFSLNNQSFSTPSNTSVSSLTFNDSTTTLNVTSSEFKKSLSITDCLTDVILIILVVLFVLFLIILLVLCCRKPAASVIVVEEEKTIIIKESRYTSNPSDIEMGEENRPNNFMALRSTFVTTSGSEDYDPTGLTNISEESETSDSVGKKKGKSKKEVDEENDDDNNEVEQQIKSKDGVEVPETLQEQPSPSLYSFTKPANVAKANKPSSIYD
ncbi:unnamed protein product [Meloidogyne enterolobii]|uniref:Uncharacterized protein n=1 Tax=Meloidogyne enterolobii TaxID=390850 RepID=A0ACB0ZYP4_MELEN